MREKAIEEIYQKKTQLEHILIRPDTYVGSTELEKSHRWVLREGNLKFTLDEITYVPALYKIFDEVLVNAADNYQRDKRMNILQVTVNPQQGFVSVLNNGKGIPVEIHKEHHIYVP
jgi:DNA topoisomerase II